MRGHRRHTKEREAEREGCSRQGLLQAATQDIANVGPLLTNAKFLGEAEIY